MLCAGLVALAWLVRLAGFAAGAMPGSDECFHAHVAAWIASHGAVPVVLPDLFGGLEYAAPPLLDLLGALEFAVFGAQSLAVLPLIFTAGTLAVLGAAGSVPVAARAWVVLLVASNLLISTWAVRFTPETLTMLCVTASAFAWVRFERAPGRGAAVVLGLLCGLATWAGPGGWLTLLLPIGTAAVRGAAGDAERAGHASMAVAVALLVGVPWLIRGMILFGSPFQPFAGAELDRALYRMRLDEFGATPAGFLLRIPAVLGPLMTAVLAMAALALATERRWGRAESLFAVAVAGMLAAAFAPIPAARHLVPFVPLLALGAAWVVAEALARRTSLVRPVGAVLLVVAALTVVRLHDVRAPANPPEALRTAFEQIEGSVPREETVLSLWTYDTVWHTRRAATWPRALGQERSPVEMFRTTDPGRFAAVMDSLGIRHILAPQSAPLEPFNGANYPESFMRCVESLVRSGDLQLVWGSEHFTLIRRTPGRGAPPLENPT